MDQDHDNRPGMYDKVHDFRIKMKLPVGESPTLLSSKVLSFQTRCMLEEISELMLAHEKEDLVEAADAIVDLVYLAVGTAHAMGLPFERLFDIVHNANLRKVPGATSRGVEQDAMKPEDWVGPEQEIKELLKCCVHTL